MADMVRPQYTAVELREMSMLKFKTGLGAHTGGQSVNAVAPLYGIVHNSPRAPHPLLDRRPQLDRCVVTRHRHHILDG